MTVMFWIMKSKTKKRKFGLFPFYLQFLCIFLFSVEKEAHAKAAAQEKKDEGKVSSLLRLAAIPFPFVPW